MINYPNKFYEQLAYNESRHDPRVMNKYRLKPLHSYVGKTVAGTQLTKAGSIAASHLIGDGGFKNFLADPKARQQSLIEDFFKNMPARSSKSSEDDEL